MPSPKRWFPLSQDVNGDPEVWEFTAQFGDRALRIWLEVLAIIDRTDNHWRLSGYWVQSLSRKVRQQPATVQRAVGWMLARGWLTAGQTAADGSPTVLSAVNFLKYHKRREPEGSQLRLPPYLSEPFPPNLPNIPNQDKKELGGDEEGLLGGKKGSAARSCTQPLVDNGMGNETIRNALREKNLPAHLRQTEDGFASIGSVLRTGRVLS